jgi:heme exporter protein CcmD
MENLTDYSFYVITSYAVAGLVLSGLMVFVVGKYLKLKK